MLMLVAVPRREGILLGVPLFGDTMPPAARVLAAKCDGHRTLGKRFVTRRNSSQLMTPVPSMSTCVRIVSAFFAISFSDCAKWFALRIMDNSARVMTASPFSSNTEKANLIFSSFVALVKLLRPIKNWGGGEGSGEGSGNERRV